MATDLRHSALSHAVGDVLQDVSELVQKELQFARAELASNLNAVLRKAAGAAIAAVFALVALLVLTEALVFALVSQGMALHIACLVVSGVAAVIAIITYAASHGRAPVTPSRTLEHMSADIRTAKEHLS
jgi:uncharacterized membrane protein YqjE